MSRGDSALGVCLLGVSDKLVSLVGLLRMSTPSVICIFRAFAACVLVVFVVVSLLGASGILLCLVFGGVRGMIPLGVKHSVSLLCLGSLEAMSLGPAFIAGALAACLLVAVSILGLLARESDGRR